MDKKAYLALVHREANVLVREHERDLRAAEDDPEMGAQLTSILEQQLGEILSDVDHLEDVLKWSELREIAPRLWRDSHSWQGVVIGAAMAALVHDVRACAMRILAGELPRLQNIQID